ncbi:MAG: glycosyltransferase [Halioglobus sp.]
MIIGEIAQLYHVSVYPVSLSSYTSQIWAGLDELNASGDIELTYTSSPEAKIEERNGQYHFPNNQHVFYLELRPEPNAKPVLVCYDLMDNEGISSWSGLEKCDLYFKRSFSKEFLKSPERPWKDSNPEWTQKIRPYGLNYPCESNAAPSQLMRNLRHLHASGGWRRQPSSELRKILARLKSPRRNASWHIPIEEFEAPPTSKTEEVVLLQTRLFADDNSEEVQTINRERVDLVRALKAAFDDRFIGGFMPSDQAQRQCPDLITNQPSDRPSYLKLLRNSQVVAFSRGLVNSVGWRFGELTANSCCIVSERMRYELPDPLVDRENLLWFHSPESCVQACDELLSNPGMAQEIRENNYEYYNRYVRPNALVKNTLDIANELAT